MQQRGRPRKRRGNKNPSVTLYLTNPIARKIHEKLSEKGLASQQYEHFLLQKYTKKLPTEERIQALKEEMAEVESQYHEKIRQITQDFAFTKDLLRDKISAIEEEESTKILKKVMHS